MTPRAKPREAGPAARPLPCAGSRGGRRGGGPMRRVGLSTTQRNPRAIASSAAVDGSSDSRTRGIPASSSLAATLSATASPSRPGMCRSITARSKPSPAAACDVRAAEGFVAGTHGVDRAPPRLELSLQRSAGAGVVVGHQHSQGCEAWQRGWRGLRRHQLEGHDEPEGAAAPRPLVGPDVAAHVVDEPTGDGQAQAGAAVGARGGEVGLGEGVEQRRGVVTDADSRVTHLSAQPHVARLSGRGRGSARPRPRPAR